MNLSPQVAAHETSHHPGGGSGGDTGLQVPGGTPEQQSELGSQHSSTAQERPGYSLSRLSSFNMCGRLLCIFYLFVVASMSVCAEACWGNAITSGDAKCLNKINRKAISITGLTGGSNREEDASNIR